MNALGWIHWERLDPAGARLFGFAEYLAALALIIVVWTIGERRYWFRLRTARWDVQRQSFQVIAWVGVLTLLTDLWRASAWPVPTGGPLTPAMWQAALGAAFLFTFVRWLMTAFLYPPKFSKHTAFKFASVSDESISGGDPADMIVLAQELSRSADAIVGAAAAPIRVPGERRNPAQVSRDLLDILADPSFCRVAVRSSGRELFLLFDALRRHPQAAPSMACLTRNILAAAVMEQASFLKREDSDWQSGYAARGQFVTRRLFGSIDTLDRMEGVFMHFNASRWGSAEWASFLRAAGTAITSFAGRSRASSSFTVSNIFTTVEQATHQLHRLNGSEVDQPDELATAREIMRFLEQTADALARGTVTIEEWNRATSHDNPLHRMAEIASKLLLDASRVTSPSWTSWWVQYNIVWTGVFDPHHGPGKKVMAEVQERVARMLWSQIKRLESFPNYVGAAILGLCLNIGWVAGNRRDGYRTRPERALLWLARRWAQKHFDWLYQKHASLATSGFSTLVTYDPSQRSLVKQWEAVAGQPEPTYSTMQVAAAANAFDGADPPNLRDFPHETTSRRRSVPTDW